MLQWAYGVNLTMEQGHEPDDGFKVTENIFNLTFEGITGKVVIDHQGDRMTNYIIEIVQSRRLKKIFRWDAVEGRRAMIYYYSVNVYLFLLF